MRADRLITILMMLQGRGVMTAEDLARECEVSVRTIYRDIEALSFAGVPVIGEGGPGGGYALPSTYRSGLEHLTSDELRALAFIRVPAAAEAIGAAGSIRNALLKLRAIGDATTRAGAESARRRILIDAPGSVASEPTPAPLATVYDAVMKNVRVSLVSEAPIGVTIRVNAEPLGLVFDGTHWNLVCRVADNLQTFLIDSFVKIEVSREQFEWDPGFDLESYWDGVRDQHARQASSYSFYAIVAPSVSGPVLQVFDGRVRRPDGGAIESSWPQLGEPVVYAPQHEWTHVVVETASFDAARSGVLSLGGSIRVFGPVALVESVLDYATRTIGLYPQQSPQS